MERFNQDVVVITGSSGLIGSAVCHRLAESAKVIGFDRPGLPHPPEIAEAVDCDLTSDQSVSAALDRVRQHFGSVLASVVHLAAYYDFSGEPSEMYEQVTVEGTRRLLRGLHPFRVEQFLFSSTMLVHAPSEPGRKIDENWPLEPKWDYPKSKVRTEQVISTERGDIPAVHLRIAGVYTDRCDSIPLAHQIQRINERWATSYVFPGDITHGQAFVHLDDVVEAIALAVQRRKQLPEETAVLIAEPETLSYDELQQQFGELIHGQDWHTTPIPKAVAKTGAWVQDSVPLIEEPFIKPWMIDLADDHYEVDISRARSLLGWRPKRSLRQTLPTMVAALKADPRGWYEAHELKPAEE